MFESEHYTSISALASIVGGWESGARAWVCSHYLLHTLQASKTGSGSTNEAARVQMLALFQNEVGYSHGQIATSLMARPSHT